MGGFDLHGRYYPNINDAINAEMAQCAAITAEHAMWEVNEMKKRDARMAQQPDPLSDEFQNVWQHIQSLEQRISELEAKLSNP